MAGKATIQFTPMASYAKKLTPPTAAEGLLAWLGKKEPGDTTPRDAGLHWLLATTFSDVVWGRKKDGVWRLSNEAADLPADLPAGRLLELRAFGAVSEVFVWRDAAGLRARLRRDEAPEAGDGDQGYDTYEEEQLLWGTVRLDGAPTGFTRLAEGEQGLAHQPPVELDGSYFITDSQHEHFGHRPARLVLRHYVGRDPETGLARVVDSRLVEVRAVKPKTDATEEAK